MRSPILAILGSEEIQELKGRVQRDSVMTVKCVEHLLSFGDFEEGVPLVFFAVCSLQAASPVKVKTDETHHVLV